MRNNENTFQRNLLSLRERNPPLYSRLAGAQASLGRYRFLQSKSGEIVPAMVNGSGASLPLHSTVDPKREAQRLVSTIIDEDGGEFITILGLGGGFAPQAALERGAAGVLVIDFDIDGIAELLCSKDYTGLLNDSRFTLLADPSADEIKNFILEQYRPALCSGIRTIPLRARTEKDTASFNAAADAIGSAVKNIAADYSVQAHFGGRWFSNIINNLKAAEEQGGKGNGEWGAGSGEAAIVAAGPSLDLQIPALADCKLRKVFIISSDTALPALLHRGIEPDAVVSIDCQHISYYHFFGCNSGGSMRNIPLFLDIASPPLLSRLSFSPHFFCSGHPLALYISQNWRPFPHLDVSGGNVTYACLSLAESLGVQRITLFGADFSYVRSRTYARGTYIYPFFEKKQNRFSPMEAMLSAFLYRNPFLDQGSGIGKSTKESPAYRETAQLRYYREMLEKKASRMEAHIIAAEGQGAPIILACKKTRNAGCGTPAPFAAGKAGISCREFLEQYRNDIAALPAASGKTNYFQSLSAENKRVFTTLLPLAAAIKHRSPLLTTADLIEEVKRRCIEKIGKG